MPRIPQGEFNDTPSSRVGSLNTNFRSSGTSEALSAAADLTNAFAQLQDQGERTEAYQYANDSKSRYLYQKTQYAAALDSVNGKGMTDYIDPTDNNPDMAKRKRIQRPISEMYSEMVESYESDKKGASNLTRGDMAGELMRTHVGDDLIELNINTNKHLNRVRTKETSETLQQNLELGFGNLVNQAVQPDANPDMVRLETVRMQNSIRREIGTVGNIIGREGVAKFQQLYDRQAATAAAQIISSGVTSTTVYAADEMVKSIRDPGQRTAAQVRLENVKKQTATVKNMTVLNSNKDLIAHVNTNPAIDDITYVKGMENVRSTMNMFTDPKYSMIGDADKQSSAADLASTLLSKRLMQQNIGNDLTFLNAPVTEGDRSPSGAAAASSRETLAASIDEEIRAAGIGGMLGNNAELAGIVRDLTMQKMRTQQASIGDNIPDIVRAQKPGLQGRALIEEIQHAAAAQGAGEVSLVGKKERTDFRANFDSEMAKDPSGALNMFNQKLIQAGSAYEGESSYRRKMAIDLVDKNPKMAYLIPLADADESTQYEMIQNASKFKTLINEGNVTDNNFQEAFVSTEMRSGLAAVRDVNPTMYEGIKQAIFHEAANTISDKGDVKSAVEKATQKMAKQYTTIPLSSSGSAIFALNRSGGIDYSTKKKELQRGAEKALQLPMLSRDEKIDILERYGKGTVLDRNNSAGTVTTPDSAIDFHLKNLVTVQPDPMYPNMHMIKIRNQPISKRDGTRIKISAEQILGYGQAESDRIKKSYSANGGN